MIRIEELMTPIVITLTESDTVARAAEDMMLGEFRHLPVVDARGQVVGMVSDRDLLRAKATRGGDGLFVREVMSRAVLVLRPEAPAFRAAELMMERKIGAVPVVDEDRALVGIVTETDLLSVAHAALHGRVGAALLSV